MKPKYWEITGYRSLKKIYEKRVKYGCFSDAQIERVLMALAAKAGLNYDEIIGAYAKKGTKISNELLHVQPDWNHGSITCGINPYFTARVINE